MIDINRARAVFLDHYGPMLERSQPYGDVTLPGADASHLMAVTDLVWIRHILGDLDLTDAQRDAWAGRINRDQEPGSGMFRYPPGTDHVDEHATWQCVAALNMLGRRPAHRLACVAALLDVEAFAAWCAAYDPATSHHRFMLAVIAAASSPPSEDWKRAFCDWYDAHQDPETGFPEHAAEARRLSPAFLLTIMRLTLGGDVPRAGRIVQTALGLQRAWGGMTDGDLPGYMEMDAALLVHRLAPLAEANAADVDACLEGIGRFLDDVTEDPQRRSRLLANPHRALAVCGTLSVLWRHAGAGGEWPVPFPWAELEHYQAPL